MKTPRRSVVISSIMLVVMVFAGLGITGCGSHFGRFGGGFHRGPGSVEICPALSWGASTAR